MATTLRRVAAFQQVPEGFSDVLSDISQRARCRRAQGEKFLERTPRAAMLALRSPSVAPPAPERPRPQHSNSAALPPAAWPRAPCVRSARGRRASSSFEPRIARQQRPAPRATPSRHWCELPEQAPQDDLSTGALQHEADHVRRLQRHERRPRLRDTTVLSGRRPVRSPRQRKGAARQALSVFSSVNRSHPRAVRTLSKSDSRPRAPAMPSSSTERTATATTAAATPTSRCSPWAAIWSKPSPARNDPTAWWKGHGAAYHNSCPVWMQ